MSSNESFCYRFSDEFEKVPGCSGPFTLTGKDLTMRVSQSDLHTVSLPGRRDFQTGILSIFVPLFCFTIFYHPLGKDRSPVEV